VGTQLPHYKYRLKNTTDGCRFRPEKLEENMNLNMNLYMSLESLIILLIVAAVVGAIGQMIAGYSLGGLLGSIVLGFIGAFLGTWIVREFRLPHIFTLQFGVTSFPIFWAIIGAVLFVSFLGMLTRRRYVSD
jgi:uncharacterized membrane protein YeaQ/YmgE (transglycosylase-associated protein family)